MPEVIETEEKKFMSPAHWRDVGETNLSAARHHSQSTTDSGDIAVFAMSTKGVVTRLGYAPTVGAACELVEGLGLRSQDLWSTWGYEPAVDKRPRAAHEGQLALALSEAG
ncbi:MAG: hypothetical protein JNK05_34770 [Myxococcales bacterium]|nr:hypothetical protein [Myxococcales bacterium]